ncbi:hypothetical protein [Embleya sp. NBC_00896]|uniref:hypothetical protein n=1 Tax=Embleya sp. NBC_00896 TaxID=2975961 RepID=UPI00386CAE95|nr:hypothetical protein OG928_10235 [Embleya sp. NBC_00896]
MVSADGDTLFAIDTENGRSELVYLKGKGQEKHVIHALDTADAGRKVQYGSSQFDGRWLLFDVAFDAENWNDWALYAWDSTAAAAPFLVTRHDKSVPGPFLFTHLRDGKAAWAEGIPDGRKAVHLYDLAGRADSVVRTGHTSPVFVAGDLLGWREAPGPREPVLVKAVSLRTGQPVALPPVIAKIRGTAHVAGDGRIWTWVSPDYTTLYAWQPGWEDSATIARAKEGEHIDQMQLAGDLVTWVGGEAVWAADIRSHSRTTLTPQYGSVASNGDSLLVTYLTGGYSKDPAKQQGTTSYVLRAPDLEPLPTCAKWVPVPQPLDETGTLDPDPGEGA